VPHLGLLGVEVLLVVLVRGELDGTLLHNVQLVPLQTDDFLRVVGHQADAADAEIEENLCSEPVVAKVHAEAQF
jgi:hypothetical protein